MHAFHYFAERFLKVEGKADSVANDQCGHREEFWRPNSNLIEHNGIADCDGRPMRMLMPLLMCCLRVCLVSLTS